MDQAEWVKERVGLCPDSGVRNYSCMFSGTWYSVIILFIVSQNRANPVFRTAPQLMQASWQILTGRREMPVVRVTGLPGTIFIECTLRSKVQ